MDSSEKPVTRRDVLKSSAYLVGGLFVARHALALQNPQQTLPTTPTQPVKSLNPPMGAITTDPNLRVDQFGNGYYGAGYYGTGNTSYYGAYGNGYYSGGPYGNGFYTSNYYGNSYYYGSGYYGTGY